MSQLKTVYQEMREFFSPLWPGEDKPLVLGEGNGDRPRLMLIGEAPGETEVVKGRPFVGRAGKNLDEFLHLAGLQREEIFVTNAVKIRPTEIGPTGRTRNRAPNREELSLFTPWLLKEIKAVRPRALVTLGNVPLKALAGPGPQWANATANGWTAWPARPSSPCTTPRPSSTAGPWPPSTSRTCSLWRKR